LKERISELLDELYNESGKIAYYDDDSRFEFALSLLRILDNLHIVDYWERSKKFFESAEKQGFHMMRPDLSSPIPTIGHLPADTWDKIHDTGIDWNEKIGIPLLQELAKYADEYHHIIESELLKGSRNYSLHDSALLYSIIRYFKPRNIIQIGSGDYTKATVLGASKNSNGGTNIISIDPFGFKGLEKIVKLIKKPCQEIPMSEFERLEKNDILFIDSSHISKIGSDVNYLFLDVLPKLKPGVLIQVNDIFIPYELPRQWTRENHWFWNEQYLLHAFLIGNLDFEVLFGTRYIIKNHPELLLNIYSDANFDSSDGISTSSFWMRRVENK
jgi:hypothetical protein